VILPGFLLARVFVLTVGTGSGFAIAGFTAVTREDPDACEVPVALGFVTELPGRAVSCLLSARRACLMFGMTRELRRALLPVMTDLPKEICLAGWLPALWTWCPHLVYRLHWQRHAFRWPVGAVPVPVARGY